MNCIQHFSNKENLEKHRQNCMAVNGIQTVKLPEEGSCIKFTKLKNTLDILFIIYADLELILIPILIPLESLPLN